MSNEIIVGLNKAREFASNLDYYDDLGKLSPNVAAAAGLMRDMANEIEQLRSDVVELEEACDLLNGFC